MLAFVTALRFDGAMPRDPFVRETGERWAAKKLAAEYFERFPKDRYQTAKSWRELQSQNISNSPEAAARADREGDGDR